MFKVGQIRPAPDKKIQVDLIAIFFLLHFTFKQHQQVSSLLLQQA